MINAQPEMMQALPARESIGSAMRGFFNGLSRTAGSVLNRVSGFFNAPVNTGRSFERVRVQTPLEAFNASIVSGDFRSAEVQLQNLLQTHMHGLETQAKQRPLTMQELGAYYTQNRWIDHMVRTLNPLNVARMQMNTGQHPASDLSAGQQIGAAVPAF
jgi:hypothetical protein